MKISFSLIKQFLDFNLSPKEVEEHLTLLGLEVDAIEQEKPTFSGVVVGQVKKVRQHPDAQRLKLAEVFDGEQTKQVVCGAPNCREGLITAFAKVGAKLSDQNQNVFTIRKTKLRGIDSCGMLCSAHELGLYEEQDQILELSDDFSCGEDLSKLLLDPVFEISLTPNLGHCMSALGVARDLAALLKKKLNTFKTKITEDIKQIPYKVQIQDPGFCARYAARAIKNVTIAPSDFWIKKQLMQCGIRPINNIVDIINLVMLELGQPMHAFDLETIEGNQIKVALSSKKEQFVGIDGVTYSLPDHSLIIQDEKKTIVLAGIMGGENTCISEKTKHILLEAAFFDPKMIRKTSKALPLRTESSQRFEKAVDYQMATVALDRASFLIQKYAGGEISPIVEEKHPPKQKKLTLRISRTNQILGTKLSLSEIANIFQHLGFTIEREESDQLLLQVPSFRNDINLEIDLIEEVARIYGFNHIQTTNPLFSTTKISHTPLFVFENQTRDQLCRVGLLEILNCDLISPKMAKLIQEADLSSGSLIQVRSFKSLEYSILRASLLPGVLETIKSNHDRKCLDLSVFEIGHIHIKKKNKFYEHSMGCIALTGSSKPIHWDQKPQDVDFFDLKGYLENILDHLKIPSFKFTGSKHPNFHPFRQANLMFDDINVGVLGEIHPGVLKKVDIKQPVLYAEFNLHHLMEKRLSQQKMQPVCSFPSSERDWTITIQKEFSCGKIVEAIQSIPSKTLQKVHLIDLYEDPKLGEDKKNLTFRFLYWDFHKTLSYEDVEKEHTKIKTQVSQALKNYLIS